MIQKHSLLHGLIMSKCIALAFLNEVFTARPKMSTGTFSDYIKVHARIYTITEHVSISGAQSLSTRQEIHS